MKTAHPPESTLAPGSVSNDAYRNPSLGITCKVPVGWVLRTDEMNAREESSDDSATSDSGRSSAAANTGTSRVLLAAFSRPPEARGEEINASIVIAAESAASYPGLKEAAQYFGPLMEIAKAQGFALEEDPYDIAVGAKTLVRGDFQKNVGTRVMRQSTLVMLARGYVVSFTFIAGTEDDVEDLVDGLSFPASGSNNHK